MLLNLNLYVMLSNDSKDPIVGVGGENQTNANGDGYSQVKIILAPEVKSG